MSSSPAQVHSDEAEVQEEGCRALANLAFAAGNKAGEAEAPKWREVGGLAVKHALAEQVMTRPEIAP